jgi:hypothetical protein
MHPALPLLTAILATPIDDRISQMERELEILRQQNASLSAGLGAGALRGELLQQQ